MQADPNSTTPRIPVRLPGFPGAFASPPGRVGGA